MYDQEGFLLNYQDWNENIAQEIAQKENIQLTDLHWTLIYFIRDFYHKSKTIPVTRALIKAINDQQGEGTLSSIKLALMFPQGVARQLSKMAGLPKPLRCI